MRPVTKPVTVDNLIRGERLAEELTPQEAAAMMTALAGVQIALANRILTARPPELPAPDDSPLLHASDVAVMLSTTRSAVYRLSQRRTGARSLFESAVRIFGSVRQG